MSDLYKNPFLAEKSVSDLSSPSSYTPPHLSEKILTNRSALEGERKLLTVLFVGLADTEGLSGSIDSESIHEIMRDSANLILDEIHKFEGTVNQFTRKGAMALFGAPVAHEDHVRRACHAALSLQDAFNNYFLVIRKKYGFPLKMRIGINSGRVYVGAIGNNLRMDYTAVGDTTNLAARMEQTAAPGTIRVSQNTYKLAAPFFNFKALGKIPVKGKRKPQETFVLISARAKPPGIKSIAGPKISPFVGRKAIMPVFASAYAKAKSGAGQVLDIIGEAGAGKSRLIMEFIGGLESKEFQYYEGNCLHYGGSLPYFPIMEILKSFFGIVPQDSGNNIHQKIKNGMARVNAEAAVSLAALEDFFSLDIEDPAYLQMNPGERKTLMFEAVRDLLVQASRQKPLIVVLEDLHWLDKATEEFISFFASSISRAGVLLVCIYRPQFEPVWRDTIHYTSIYIPPLETADGCLLIHSIIGNENSAIALENLIIEKSGGNPLFIEELTYHLINKGLIGGTFGRSFSFDTNLPIELPDTIENVIAARIDRLEEENKRVLQTASVIGQGVDPRFLESIMGISSLADRLADLQTAEFLSVRQGPSNTKYMFRHELIREVAYNSLVQKVRKAIHEKAAITIEKSNPGQLEENCELLAYHYRRSGNRQKAIAFLEMANQKAIRLSALQMAMETFNEAMNILDEMDNSAPVQERRIQLVVEQYYPFLFHLKISEYLDLLNRYRAAAINSESPYIQMKFNIATANCRIYLGQLREAELPTKQAIAIADDSGHSELAVEAYVGLFFIYFMRSEYHRMHQAKENVFGLLEKRFSLHVYAHTSFPLILTLAEAGYCNQAISEAEKLLNMAREYSNSSIICLCLIHIALAYCLKNEPLKARDYSEQALSRIKTPMEEGWVRNWHAYILCRCGPLDQGIAGLEAVLEIMRQIKNRPVETEVLNYLGEAYYLARNTNKAAKCLANAKAMAEKMDRKWCQIRAIYYLGKIALENRSRKSRQYFKKCIEMARPIEMQAYLAKAYAGLGGYYRQQGEIEKSRHCLTKSLKIYEALDILDEPEKVKKELAKLPEAN